MNKSDWVRLKLNAFRKASHQMRLNAGQHCPTIDAITNIIRVRCVIIVGFTHNLGETNGFLFQKVTPLPYPICQC